MKRLVSFSVVHLLFISLFAQTRNIAIIPEPVQLVNKTGTFLLPSKLTVSVSKGEGMDAVVNALKEKLKVTGSSLVITRKGATSNLQLQ